MYRLTLSDELALYKHCVKQLMKMSLYEHNKLLDMYLTTSFKCPVCHRVREPFIDKLLLK